MKKASSLIALAGLVLASLSVLPAQNIVQLEYFFDNDPGFGLGTQVSITPDTILDLSFNASLAEVPDGFHYLFTRARDADGHWTQPVIQPFLKSTLDTTPIVKSFPDIVQLEYFVDTDPGLGLATQVPFVPDSSLDSTFNASLASVADGFHYLTVRGRAANGLWTHSCIQPFLKSTLDTTSIVKTFPDIIQLEYFIDTDPGLGLATQVPITPDSSLDLTLNASLASVADGFHYLTVRGRAANGLWTHSYIQPFLKSTINSESPISPENIISIHYGIEQEGTELLSGVYTNFLPTTNLDLEFNIDIAGLDADSNYELHIAVEDEGSDQSFEHVEPIIVINSLQAINDTLVMDEDSSITADVVANDIDADGDTLSVIRISEPRNGVAVIGTDTSITYTPSEHFFGSDSFIYVARDEYYQEDSAQICITVLPINDAPVITSSDIVYASEFEYFKYQGIASDVDNPILTWSFSDLPSWLSAMTDSGSVVGTPHDGDPDTSFQVMVSDGELTDTLLVLVIVRPLNTPPGSFSLISPSNNADVATQTPLLDWAPAIDPDLGDTVRYTLYLDTNEEGGESILTDTSSSFQVISPLTDNTTYHWRVAARDLAGATTENTGGYHSFRVNTENDPPSEFALLSPSDGAMIVDLTPGFHWQESVDPDDPLGVSYRFYLDTDSLFSGTVPVTMDSTDYALFTDLQEDQVYYWKVMAVDVSGGETASQVWWFWTNSVNSPPEEFVLATPVDDEELTTLTPTFRWEASGDPDIADSVTYALELGAVVDNLAAVYAGKDTVHTPAAPLTDNTTYYWRVAARDLAGATTENTGGYHSFRVNTENDPPSEFALLSPSDGAMIVDLTPGFHWQESVDPDDPLGVSYRFYLDTDSLFSGTVPVTMDSTDYALFTDLQEDQVYYWQVVAVDVSGGETASQVWWFWTNSVNSPPEEFVLATPVDDEELTTLTPTFRWEASGDPDIADSVTYSLELGAVVDNLAAVYTGKDTVHTPAAPLTDNTTYHWRVAARDLAGAIMENTGGFNRFATNLSNEPPEPAFLVTPTDSSLEVDLTPLFYWTKSIDPDPNDIVTYQLFCWPSAQIVPTDSVTIDSNSVEITTPLLDNTEFLWSVKCIDNHGLALMTEPVLFWTDAFPEAPLPFAAISPSADSTGLPTEVEFIWNSTKDPDPVDLITYRVVLAADWNDSSTYEWHDSIADTSIILSLEQNTVYYWLVEAIDKDSLITFSNEGIPIRFAVGQPLSLVGWNAIPEEFALYQNYPNPFNPTSTIRYDLPQGSTVSLVVYDITGRDVARLVDQHMEPGYHQVVWDSRDKYGREVPSGIYIARLFTPEHIKSIKMVLLK
ncbi:MAG: cadherin-like domain-containing protein [Fidelibacterota bacterium]|nr:MAG: cadherin-like domain-containing protein [Candidatus Neomarinimicrobiota bacterium]